MPRIRRPAADEMPMPKHIGVIGIGVMGHPIAQHIQRAQREVEGELIILERSAQHAPDLIEAGARVVSSPADMARATSVIVMMLPDLVHVAAAIDGPDGILAGVADDRHVVLVVGSTVSAPALIALAARLGTRPGRPIRIVDAPVSGGEEGAKAATLSIMVGADDADADAAWPVLCAYGSPRRLGSIGAGQTAKACNQLIVASTVAALGEAAVIGQRAGLDLHVLFDLLGNGYAASRILETRRHRFVDDDFSVSGAARYMTKDLHAAEALAAELNVKPSVLPALAAFFADLESAGYGDFDIAVAKKFISDRSE